MSSMTSYTVGSPTSAKIVYESWLKYFQENEKKLLNELRKNIEFEKYRENNILNEDKFIEIEKQFRLLYKPWSIKTVSNRLRENIIKNMHQYILQVKAKLYMTFENLIQEEISKYLQSTQEEIYTVETQDKSGYRETLLNEIELILEKVKKYDKDIYIKLQKNFQKISNAKSIQKIKIFHDNIKLEYGILKKNIIWTKVYKVSLNEFQKNVVLKQNIKLIKEIDLLLQQKEIREDEYNELYKKVQKVLVSKKEQEVRVDKIIEALEKLNYFVIEDKKEKIVESISKREKVELPVKNQNYRVVFKLNSENKLITRFVRVVQNKEDIEYLSTSEKLKDAENLKKWCEYQKKFITYIQEEAFDINQTIIEDEKSEVLYVMDKALKKNESERINKQEGRMING